MSVGALALTSDDVMAREGNAQVLVVDDDADLVEALVEFIEATGYTAAGVNTGSEALAYLRRAPVAPRVMLVDVKMPEMDGLQLLAKVNVAEPLMQVVIISGHDVRPVSIGAAARVLAKPLDIDALYRILAESCGRA